MRLPVSWLREYVEVDLPAGELAERLLMAGLAVEGVERVGEEFRRIRVGRVEHLDPHPRRPDLKVARVNLGDGAVQAVTGAPNARPGLVTAVATEGVYLPAVKLEVRVSDFAGVRSEAVVLSPKEAGVSEDASGLWELPEGAPVGRSVAEVLELEDDVLEVDVYPNRADCMSVIGLAREVAAALGLSLRLPPSDFPEADEPAEALCDVAVDDARDCPRYLARVMWELPRGGSPWWLARRLHLAGMRTVHPVVDVTNYVMLEVGQPLHAFDLHRLTGQRVVVRRARAGEALVTLDGKRRDLDDGMLVIADAEQPQALAGIMGGADSEVQPATRAILLESATFHPALIRRTSRRLGLRTEASARFERGLATALAEWGSRRAAALLTGMGARVARGSVDRRTSQADGRTLTLRPERVNRLLGTALTASEIGDHLRRLGMEVRPVDGRLVVQVPGWRRDVAEEDDLAEEVARLYGYDRIPTTLPEATARGRMSEETDLGFAVRRALAAAGLHEVVTYTFMSPGELRALGMGEGHPWQRALAIANPLSDEQSHLRTTLLPGLVRVLKLNANRREGDIRIFEVGRVFWPVQSAEPARGASLPEERLVVGIAMLSVPSALPRRWYESPRALDFYDLKGAIEALGKALGVEVAMEAAEFPGLHPGRSARVWVEGPQGERAEAGVAGEVHPAVAAGLDLPGRALLAELALSALVRVARREPVRFSPLPRFPSVVRDLALVVPRDMPAGRLLELVRRHAGPYAQRVDLFDVYTGPGLPEGSRSLGVSVTYQAPDRTLSDEEVDQARKRLVAALAEAGIRLR